MAKAGEPLSVLVSRVLVPLVWELEDDVAECSLAVWADLLRALPYDGATEKELLSLAHVSPRSMHVLVGGAERRGLVVTDARTKVVKITASGREARTVWEERVATTEARWKDTAELAAAVRAVVAGISIDLPWLLLPYGPSDGRANVGPPVARTTPVDALPVFALLSQLLAALSLSYESRNPWMLSMMSAAIAAFPDDGLPLEAVPALADVRGNGKTLHERHGIVVVEHGTARLTDRGRRLRDGHAPALQAVEADWIAQDGPEGLAAVRRALEAIAPRLPTGHVHHLQMQYAKGGPAYREANQRPHPD